MSYKSTQCYIESFTYSQTLTRRSNNKIILENIKVVQLEHIPFRHAGITVYLSLSDKLTQSVYSTVSIVAKVIKDMKLQLGNRNVEEANLKKKVHWIQKNFMKSE